MIRFIFCTALKLDHVSSVLVMKRVVSLGSREIEVIPHLSLLRYLSSLTPAITGLCSIKLCRLVAYEMSRCSGTLFSVLTKVHVHVCCTHEDGNNSRVKACDV